MRRDNINLSPQLLPSLIFGLLLQEVNLLPKLENPVTRQEKMATVWDEAEVRAGRAGGRGAGASGETHVAEAEAVVGGGGGSRSNPVPGLGPLGLWAGVPTPPFWFYGRGVG